MGRPTKDITGLTFGRLTAVKLGVAGKHTKWICVCVCGKECSVYLTHLLSGNTKSCGCMPVGLYKHGHTVNRRPTAEYACWANMKQRVLNFMHPRYSEYGGRGIAICDRWVNSFENFLADMGERPSPEMSINRIDNEGNYEPGNCEWATSEVQVANQRPRRSHLITNL